MKTKAWFQPWTRRTPLLVSVFVMSGCALVYQLMIATISSYLLGDSVYQFSLTLGLFLLSLGIGSYISRWLTSQLIPWFVAIELLLGTVGGFTAVLLFLFYAASPAGYQLVTYSVIVAIGLLVGMEIPLISRILAQDFSLRSNLANVLSLDYVGATVGAVAFPLLLLPYLGLIRTSLLTGLANIAVAAAAALVYPGYAPSRRALAAMAVLSAGPLAVALVLSQPIESYLEQRLYRAPVIYSQRTPYQQITLTQWKDDLRLFLDGRLQFSSVDEYRYHEALVHPAMSMAQSPRKVLIMGGGDGLSLREVLKYREVQQVTLVDLDRELVDLFRRDARLTALNQGSLSDPRVRFVYMDAFKFLEEDSDMYDVAIADFPDPRNENLQKLYTVEFYLLLDRRLRGGGAAVTQATSPYFANLAFWSIHDSMAEVWPYTVPFHLDIPSFGDWGFVVASRRPLNLEAAPVRVPTQYLNSDVMQRMEAFGEDEDRDPAVLPNRLLRPVLMRYYAQGWGADTPGGPAQPRDSQRP